MEKKLQVQELKFVLGHLELWKWVMVISDVCIRNQFYSLKYYDGLLRMMLSDIYDAWLKFLIGLHCLECLIEAVNGRHFYIVNTKDQGTRLFPFLFHQRGL